MGRYRFHRASFRYAADLPYKWTENLPSIYTADFPSNQEASRSCQDSAETGWRHGLRHHQGADRTSGLRPASAAGAQQRGAIKAPVETMPLDDWRRVFEVTVFGKIALTQALLPALRRGRGRIVNISSAGVGVSISAAGAFLGSKFAVERWATRSVRGSPSKASASRSSNPERCGRRRLAHACGRLAHRLLREGWYVGRAGCGDLDKAATALRPRIRYTIGCDNTMLTRLAAPARAVARPRHRPHDAPAPSRLLTSARPASTGVVEQETEPTCGRRGSQVDLCGLRVASACAQTTAARRCRVRGRADASASVR
ncbi:SDR family NAD(P)-dependent oxidoreductase [Microbacterium sp. NPDC088619]|uniref:SDR family NAD(P)-dependent oxidoreductase n=1 Tax=Microbacterium sp. NPDC088619 TaxID=3364196 RepID=UPI003816D6A1